MIKPIPIPPKTRISRILTTIASRMIRSPNAGCSTDHARANQKVKTTLIRIRVDAPKTPSRSPVKSTIIMLSIREPLCDQCLITPIRIPMRLKIKITKAINVFLNAVFMLLRAV